METSQPLSIESFSYSWLINLQPSLGSLDSSLRASFDASDDAAAFIEMDPKMTPSKRFNMGDSQNFNFNFPISQSPLAVVHADELFSNGLLMPLFADSSKLEAYGTSVSTPSPPISSESSRIILPTNRIHCPFLRRCRRSSRRILQKYLCFFCPLYRKVRGSRTSTKTETIDTRVKMVKSHSSSLQTSPQTSTACSSADWCNIEHSIYEAVLHCKKSIET